MKEGVSTFCNLVGTNPEQLKYVATPFIEEANDPCYAVIRVPKDAASYDDSENIAEANAKLATKAARMLERKRQRLESDQMDPESTGHPVVLGGEMAADSGEETGCPESGALSSVALQIR